MKKRSRAGKNIDNRTIGKHRRIRFEFLEQREMLAGDVKAVVTAGALTLTGDFQDNSIILTQVSPGRYSVQPVDFNGATSVNGSKATYITPVGSPVTSVTINMDGGNDRVVMKNMTINGDLKIALDGKTPNGQNDSLTMQNVVVNGLTTIDTGNGNDSVMITNSIFNGAKAGPDLTLTTGTGQDNVRIQSAKFTNDLSVNSGGENDKVIISNVQVGHNATVQAGGGNSQLSFTHSSVGQFGKGSKDTLKLDAGKGADATIQVQDVKTFNFTVDTGTGKSNVTIDRISVQGITNYEAVGSTKGDPMSGDDTLKITNSGFRDDLIIDTGAGNDSVTLDNVSITNGLYLFTQDGHDKVSLNRVGASVAKIDLGTEDDSIAICNSIIGTLNLQGGPGNDALTLFHNSFGLIDAVGFETTTNSKGGGGPIGPGKP